MWKVPFLTFYIFVLNPSWSYKFSTPDGLGEKQVQVPLYEELTASLPLVLQNLSNYSGLINDKQSPPSKNITYHFGNLTKDLAMLSDKVSGFYMVLHDMIPEGEGPYLCPIDKPNHIKECLLIATCLLEEHVPEDIDLPTFQSYMEMTQPFLEISWPILKRALMLEEATPVLDQDKVAPAKYQCDLLKHKTVKPVKPQPEVFFLQESSMEGKAALHLSNRVIQASQESHQILEEHTKVGSSSDSHVDATIVKLHSLWQPVCQQLGCDHSNFWDVQLASYRQSTSLLQVQSGVAARRAARTEAQQRARLKVRMVKFVTENTQYFRRILNSSSPGRRFFDASFVQESSRVAFKQHAQRGREAMMRTVIPFMENIANANETRALNLLDQVEFRKFQQRKQRGKFEQGEQLQEEHDEESEEEKFQEEDEEMEKEQEDQEDQDEQEDEEEDDQLEYSNMTSEVQTPSQAARHRALLSMDMDLLEDESEDEELDGKRRRRRRRRRARRRRWIGGRRRRRRRRRLFKKIVAAVSRAVEDIVEFMAEGLGCLGIGVEFFSTGYGQELTSAVGVGVGLSAGASATLQQIVDGQNPTAFISLDFGFAVGVATPATWTGIGLGGSVSCDSSGCDAYLTVASIAAINLPVGGWAPACPLGSQLGSASCESTYGYGVSTMCCTMDLARGSNDCR